MGEYKFKLPDIGEGVVEAEITAWHVALGDRVAEDDPIADAMTDKATIELTAPVDGVISMVACEAGEILAVGADLVIFEIEGESAQEPSPMSTPKPAVRPKAPRKNEAKNKTKKSSQKKQTFKSDKGQNKALASPAVRKRAKEMDVDLAKVKASGKDGQVTQADLDLLEKSFEIEEGETRIKVIGLRRVISQRMQEAKRHIPHFTYVEEIDVTELEAFRRRVIEKAPDEKPKLTVLPFIIRALATTLQDWPQFNARFIDESIASKGGGGKGGYVSQFSDLHLGIATQTDKGLVVPVLRKAQMRSVWDLAAEIMRLAEGARNNSLSTKELTGATTTLTSLGPLGGLVTTPVINRPEVAIFGPNKIRTKLVLEDVRPKERLVLNYSLSCDHRVIDGYDAAKMMQEMKALLEDPKMMFLS